MPFFKSTKHYGTMYISEESLHNYEVHTNGFFKPAPEKIDYAYLGSIYEYSNLLGIIIHSISWKNI